MHSLQRWLRRSVFVASRYARLVARISLHWRHVIDLNILLQRETYDKSNYIPETH